MCSLTPRFRRCFGRGFGLGGKFPEEVPRGYVVVYEALYHVLERIIAIGLTGRGPLSSSSGWCSAVSAGLLGVP